jgi:Zn-dependent protease with chaperone function
MELTPKQFEEILERVFEEKTSSLATKKQVEDLTTTVDGLAQKVDSYLTKEWIVHINDSHPRLEKRINSIENKFKIKTI